MISQYFNECLLPKYGDDASQQIHKTWIVIPKNYFTSTVILIYSDTNVILHYILLIKFY